MKKVAEGLMAPAGPKSMREASQPSYPAWRGTGMTRPVIPPPQPQPQRLRLGPQQSCRKFWLHGENMCGRDCGDSHDRLDTNLTRSAAFQDAQRSGVLPLWTTIQLLLLASRRDRMEFTVRAGDWNMIQRSRDDQAAAEKIRADRLSAPEQNRLVIGSASRHQHVDRQRLTKMTEAERMGTLRQTFLDWYRSMLAAMPDEQAAEQERLYRLHNLGYGPSGEFWERMAAHLAIRPPIDMTPLPHAPLATQPSGASTQATQPSGASTQANEPSSRDRDGDTAMEGGEESAEGENGGNEEGWNASALPGCPKPPKKPDGEDGAGGGAAAPAS